MKILKIINLVLLVLLSISAGVAKVMKVPEELQFFTDAGLGVNVLVFLGALQILGGVLLVLKKPGCRERSLWLLRCWRQPLSFSLMGISPLGCFRFCRC